MLGINSIVSSKLLSEAITVELSDLELVVYVLYTFLLLFLLTITKTFMHDYYIPCVILYIDS